MLIRDTFATQVTEKIEPVVKVADRRPAIVQAELANLVVTPQWERHIHTVLDAYVDAAQREHEQGVGTWISGFFGSGKSLLMKTLGILLEGGQVGGMTVAARFLDRLPAKSEYRADIERLLHALALRKVVTTAVGGNLHSMLTDESDRLPLIVFKLFAEHRGYTHNWPFGWAIEYQIDEQGKSEAFRARAAELTGADWEEIVIDPEYYLEDLYRAAADTLGNHFSGPNAVEQAVAAVTRSGIDATRIVSRFRRWCEQRDGDGTRHKLWFQLDELGQWIASGDGYDRTSQIQAMVEEAAERGAGRIWFSVTAHGDVQALSQNVAPAQFARIISRFAQQCKLSNEDISQVVEERVLAKTQAARSTLDARFNQRMGEIVDMGSAERPQRVYPLPTTENFALFYPYLPWTVTVIPDVVKGIAQAANRDEALTGSNRTMIAVVQGTLIETPGLLDSPIGRLVSLAELYPQLAADVAVETKTDLNRIGDTVQNATAFTTQVARGLFLLGQAEYIPTTLDNVTRAVVGDLDANLAALRRQVKTELERLIAAGYAKQIGDRFLFLNTQQRSFQDKVRARRDELITLTADLIQYFHEQYSSESALRFERVPIADREIVVKVDLDGRTLKSAVGASVTVCVYSPLYRVLDPTIGDDGVMRQRSAQEANTIFVRMFDNPEFRRTLAMTNATDEVSSTVANRPQAGGEADIARLAREADLPVLKDEVRKLLSEAIRGATLFFRGTPYQLAAGDSAGEAVRATLGQLLPLIYPRFYEVTHRIGNEQAAVRAALANNQQDKDLRSLGIYRADGTLNDGHPLISALRGRLPLAEQDQEPLAAAELRREFEGPPYGWDGNAVKVGLALLLRASSCRLIEGGQYITDPTAPQADQALALDARFRSLRVQGVRTELDMSTLVEIRNSLRTIFALANSVPIVAATLNSVLAEQLGRAAERAGDLDVWATTIQCPLPLAFQSGSSLVQELLNIGAATRRLSAFRDQREQVAAFVALLAELETFRVEQGPRFGEVRTLYMEMRLVEEKPADVTRFVENYNVLDRERTITVSERWNELNRSFGIAQQALVEQAATWRREMEGKLAGLNRTLEEQVEAAGVPEAERRNEAAVLGEIYEPIRRSVGEDARSYSDLRALRARWMVCETQKDRALQELRERYRVAPPISEKHVRWAELVDKNLRIESQVDIDRLTAMLQDKLSSYLEDGTIKTVVIDG